MRASEEDFQLFVNIGCFHTYKCKCPFAAMFCKISVKTLAMFPKILLLHFFFFFFFLLFTSSQSQENFTYDGFHGANANVSLNGLAAITDGGLLKLTNSTHQHIGRAFRKAPLRFKDSSNGKAFSFSTTFVAAIVPDDPNLGGHGIAFVISPSTDFPGAIPSQYLGLFNAENNGKSSNHVLAVELDTIQSLEFEDINNNHVGIDIDGLKSIQSAPASYFTNGANTSITLISGEPMQVWIDYDGAGDQLNVTIAPIKTQKPESPLLSSAVNLSSVAEDEMYVGFSSSTGSVYTSHYILGWSFKMNGEAPSLNLSSLPSFPNRSHKQNKKAMVLEILLPFVGAAFVLAIILVIVSVIKRIKFAELLEDWELEYGPHRFSYKELYLGTKGFSDRELLGTGGFGSVYKGVLPTSKIQVAVKKISHGSKQGMREFVAEIASIGRIRHGNLVRLLGYCRRKRELLLVYDFMPNGSMDKLLFDQTEPILSWGQRYHIIKGVATGLLYLHEEWVQVVLHRDIKASNVLLDHESNGALGDFGLARLYDHGSDPQTTHMVGTFGYLAPELTRTGKVTTGTDVFAFGVFLLEVACGRRPLSCCPSAEEGEEDLILVDWVVECWKREVILEAADPNLRGEFVVEEMEMVLKLALLCSHPLAVCRPSMKQVVQFLDGSARFPNLLVDGFGGSHLKLGQNDGFDDIAMSFPSSAADSFLSGGR